MAAEAAEAAGDDGEEVLAMSPATPSKGSKKAAPVPRRPAIPQRKDGKVCIMNRFSMHC